SRRNVKFGFHGRHGCRFPVHPALAHTSANASKFLIRKNLTGGNREKGGARCMLYRAVAECGRLKFFSQLETPHVVSYRCPSFPWFSSAQSGYLNGSIKILRTSISPPSLWMPIAPDDALQPVMSFIN